MFAFRKRSWQTRCASNPFPSESLPPSNMNSRPYTSIINHHEFSENVIDFQPPLMTMEASAVNKHPLSNGKNRRCSCDCCRMKAGIDGGDTWFWHPIKMLKIARNTDEEVSDPQLLHMYRAQDVRRRNLRFKSGNLTEMIQQSVECSSMPSSWRLLKNEFSKYCSLKLFCLLLRDLRQH